MALRLVQFLAVMLTALALVHLAALPNKMAMVQAAYFVTQQIIAGWALLASRKKNRAPRHSAQFAACIAALS